MEIERDLSTIRNTFKELDSLLSMIAPSFETLMQGFGVKRGRNTESQEKKESPEDTESNAEPEWEEETTVSGLHSNAALEEVLVF